MQKGEAASQVMKRFLEEPVALMQKTPEEECDR